MRNRKWQLLVILPLAIAGCSRRPSDERIDVKTSMLPESSDDRAFSDYQPAKAFAATNEGMLARTVFESPGTAGTHIQIRDWKLAPGKQTSPISLPGAAFIEVRSGSGTLQAGGQGQELQIGKIVALSQGAPFTVGNSGKFEMVMRVYVVSES